MGSKVLKIMPLIAWLAIVSGEEKKDVPNPKVTDNVSAESAPQLYPDGFKVYASGAPHYTFTVNAPFINDISRSASHFVPVKEENVFIQNRNGYLKDSYGNKFLETPLTAAYKTALPQQYVRLQDLPSHLSKPLIGGSNYHFNGFVPFTYGSPIKATQKSSAIKQAPVLRFNGANFPTVYAESVRGLTIPQGHYRIPHSSPQQQSSNSKVVYADKHMGYGFLQQPKNQRLETKIRIPNDQKVRLKIEKSPDKHVTVLTSEDGKKTTIAIDTKPTIPLLDLNLLQPLTFDNPIVPQMQHFLPKINYKLPELDESKQHRDEFIVKKTKYYDTGVIKDNPSSAESDEDEDDGEPEPKPDRRPANDNVHNSKPPAPAPTITVNGESGGPFTYELKTPNHKETFHEQVIKYDSATNKEPVHYTYDKKTEKKPIVYSYTTSSKQPIVNKQLQYEVHNQGPKQVVYSYDSREVNPKQGHQRAPPEQEDSSSESREDEDSSEESPRLVHEEYENYEGPPKQSHQLHPEHREQHYNNKPKQIVQSTPYHFVQDGPPQQYSQGIQLPVEGHIPQVQTITPHYFEENIQLVPSSAAPHSEENSNDNYDGFRPINVQSTFAPHHSQDHSEAPIQYVSSSPSPHHDHNQQSHHHHRPSSQAPPRHYQTLPSPQDHQHPPQHLNHEHPPQHLNHEHPQQHLNHEHPPQHLNHEHPPQHLNHEHPPQHLNHEHPPQHLNHEHPPQHLNHEHPPQHLNHEHLPQHLNHQHPPQHVHHQHPPQHVHHQHPQQHVNHQHQPQVNHQHPPSHQNHHHSSLHQNQQHQPSPHNYQHQSSPLNHHHNPPPPSPQHHQSSPSPHHPKHQQQTHHSEHKRPVKHHPESHHNPESHRHPERHHHPEPHHQPKSHHHPETHHHQDSRHHAHSPGPHVVEKSRKIIIQEETPDEMHSLHEQMVAAMVDEENNKEEDFEKAYKNAAFGFPAYEKQEHDIEKDIYDPESYGVPRQESYDFEHSPFQQYQQDGDDFPKSARLSYRDDRDSLKEDYFLDFASSKPESFTDRYKNKLHYIKMLKKQKPTNFFDLGPQKQQKSAKLTAEPFFSFGKQKKPTGLLDHFSEGPMFEYNYAKESPKDNSAFASGLLRRTNTLFAEPQFQYGFEPISSPNVLDSELSAMATSLNPHKEEPGTRKKIYKENWYIKKTSTNTKPAS